MKEKKSFFSNLIMATISIFLFSGLSSPKEVQAQPQTQNQTIIASKNSSMTVSSKLPAIEKKLVSINNRAKLVRNLVNKLKAMPPTERDTSVNQVYQEAKRLNSELRNVYNEIASADLPDGDQARINYKYFNPLKGILDPAMLNFDTLADDARNRISGIVGSQPSELSCGVDWKTCDGSDCVACCNDKPREYYSWCRSVCAMKVLNCRRSKPPRF